MYVNACFPHCFAVVGLVVLLPVNGLSLFSPFFFCSSYVSLFHCTGRYSLPTATFQQCRDCYSSLCSRPTPNRTRMSAEKLPSSCELLTCPGSLLAGWAYRKYIVLGRAGCCHSGSLRISHHLTYAWIPWCAATGRKSERFLFWKETSQNDVLHLIIHFLIGFTSHFRFHVLKVLFILF